MASRLHPPQALGCEPEDDPTACMFCGRHLADAGLPFVEHVAKSASCREAYHAWLERLDEDWPGG